MPTSLTLNHKTKDTIINNWNNMGNNSWWITGFNPKYKNLKAEDLTVSFSVKFENYNMFNQFSKTTRKGWSYDKTNKIEFKKFIII